MDKIIKLSSVQSDFNTSNKNLVDFVISKGEVYDMKNSYLNFNVSLDTTDTNEASNLPTNSGGRQISNCDIEIDMDFNGIGAKFLSPNVSIVKNAYLSADNVGKVEDLRDVESIKILTNSLEKTMSEQKDSTYKGITGKEGTKPIFSPIRDLKKLGDVESDNKTKDLRVELKDIFNSCDSVMDTNKTGNLKLHLECNFDRLSVSQSYGATDPFWNLQVVYPDDRQEGVFNDFGTASGSVSVKTLTASRKYRNDLRDSPYYVGQKLALTGTLNSNPITVRERKIVKIERNATTPDLLDLTFDSAYVDLVNGDELKDVSAVGVDIASSNVNINSVELVLKVLENPKNVPSNITYYTYSKESDQPAQQANFSKVYQIEPNCMNVYINTQNRGVPKLNNLESFRYRIDNKEQTDRKINMRSGLHRDQIRKTYLNNGRQLKNVSLQALTSLGDDQEDRANMDVICFPMKNNPEPSLLGLDLTCSSGGVSNLGIYKEIIKTI
jgi:hypothetical protein